MIYATIFFMYEVRVETDFSAAHFLRDYNGKCENLHGHNYKVFAHVRGKKLNEGGMLLDFSKLKSALKKICNALDHTNLNDIEFFNQNPSAERIAFFIYEKLVAELEAEGLCSDNENGGAYLHSVDVFETETSRATYSVS